MPGSFRVQETRDDLARRIIALTGEVTSDSATIAIAKLLFLANQSAREIGVIDVAEEPSNGRGCTGREPLLYCVPGATVSARGSRR